MESMESIPEQNWKAERIAELEAQFAKHRDLLHIAQRIIKALPEYMHVWIGANTVYVQTDDHAIVYLIVKTLGVKFDKSVEDDGLNYRSANVQIYGKIQPPGCKLIQKTRHVKGKFVPAHDETYYEMDCTDSVKS